MFSLKFKTLFKYHFFAALVIAAWLTIFLILIAPFDVSELPFLVRLEIMPVYGFISFVGYIILIPFQYWLSKINSKSIIYLEILIIGLFNFLVLIGSYTYYKSSIINGDGSFIKFTFEIYHPIFFILLPIIIFARWFIHKKNSQSSAKIILKGNNKLDILQIEYSDLVCISSADNYVKVTYLINGNLNAKLLRTTLKNIERQFPDLIKVHRSHTINPIHFKEWKNATTIRLTQMEIPVSKKYKNDVLAMNHLSLKTDNSPQY